MAAVYMYSTMFMAATLLVAALSVEGSTRNPSTRSEQGPVWWKPSKAMAFQYQLGKTFNINTDIISGVSAYVVDCWETPASTVAAMKAKGLFAVGYFSAGSWENWRSDKAAFPTAALGKALDGWAGEKWLDVRNTGVRNVMTARIKMCKDKGFLGVDPDNVDGYTNPTGFPLKYADQIAYNKFLADTAHSMGLAAGLKNDVDQLGDLVASFDFAINEQCNMYSECSTYAPFKAANKPVWNIEYVEDMSKTTFMNKACTATTSTGLRSILSKLSLDATYRVPCTSEGTPAKTG